MTQVTVLQLVLTVGIFLLGSLPSICYGQEGASEMSEGTTHQKIAIGNPIPADAGSVAKGKKMFMQGCAICHGDRGRGDGTAAIALEASPRDLADAEFMRSRTDGGLFKTLTEGMNEMPSFEEAYTEEERWHIVNYVRTLSQND